MGSFCETPASVEQCPAGTSNPDDGATSADACLACSVGKISVSAGSASCDDCAAGSYCDSVGTGYPCGALAPVVLSGSVVQASQMGTYTYVNVTASEDYAERAGRPVFRFGDFFLYHSCNPVCKWFVSSTVHGGYWRVNSSPQGGL